jgi:hypothetical protein
MRFARSGALVRIVTEGGACEVCRDMANRTYIPSEVPRLPVRGCRREPCRCRFVAVDPESKLTVPELIQWGVRVLKEGRTEMARRILRRAVALDEMDELGWLWLSAVVDDESKIECLEKVLAINPQNQRAREGLDLLRAKRASPATVVSEPVSPEWIEIREERQVILEQWIDFMGFAVNMDARTLLAQGRAFLLKLDDLNKRALGLIAPGTELAELESQWQGSGRMMAALRDALQMHRSGDQSSSGWQAMDEAIHGMIQQLLDRQNTLQGRIVAAGGQAPEG